MTLPPLPQQLAAFAETQARHCALNDMVEAYGQQCAKDALLRVLALIPGGPTMDPLKLRNEILEMLK